MKQRARDLTAAQQDYLEVIWLLGRKADWAVSVSQIGERLGVKPPSVTRAVRELANGGYLRHQPRGLVRLTPAGRRQAEMIHHIHQDVLLFLQDVLGVPAELAEGDASQIEHCLSPLTAQRLHEWLLMLDGLPPAERPFLPSGQRKAALFEGLAGHPSAGWRV